MLPFLVWVILFCAAARRQLGDAHTFSCRAISCTRTSLFLGDAVRALIARAAHPSARFRAIVHPHIPVFG